MLEYIRQRVRDTPLLYNVATALQGEVQRRWYLKRPESFASPPHSIKTKVVREYGRKYGLSTLVETGTFKGQMVYAQRRHFDRIISIELSDDLFHAAAERFKSYDGIQILHGDSGSLLPTIVGQLTEPALFWLDAHYSGGVTARGATDTPISKELDAILSDATRGHVVLIDDAREFNGTNGYPRLRDLEHHLLEEHPHLSFACDADMIRICPQ